MVRVNPATDTPPGLRPPKPRAVWLRAALYLALWTLIALFFASQTWLYGLYVGREGSFGRALIYPATDAALWSVLALGTLRLARRFPFEHGRVLRALLVHLTASALFSTVESALANVVFQQLGLFAGTNQSPIRMFSGMLIGKFHTNVLTYGAILGIAHLFDYYRRFRDRELRASQLETRLAQAQLEVLRMQLHPHFLFNTLHAISALMHRDVEAADRMMAKLSDLLRMALESSGAQEVPLQQELEFLGGYLEIQQIRFGERLAASVEAEPETLDALVPNLILQPLVENAIRHGIGPRLEGGRLEVRAWRAQERLRLEVRDDGPGLQGGEAPPFRQGLGLANTRARLRQLYGDGHDLELANDPGGGLRVAFSVPFRLRPSIAGIEERA